MPLKRNVAHALIILMLLHLSSAHAEKTWNADSKLRADDVGVEQISPGSSHYKRKLHPLPPAAMPGIINDYEPSLDSQRGKKMVLSELRNLKNEYMTPNKNRVRRSPRHPRPISQLPPFTQARRNRRDLRRLRRDLGYDSPSDVGGSIITQQPFAIPKTLPAEYYYGQPFRYEDRNLALYLEGLDFLEQLALLTQAREVPPVIAAAQRRPVHAPPSRFAPQPKLFLDDELPQRQARIVTYPMRRSSGRSQDLIWIPEKRWPRSMESLSMMPGFKRSVFREAARKQKQRALGQNEMSSLAAILGAEVDPEVNRIRRAAM